MIGRARRWWVTAVVAAAGIVVAAVTMLPAVLSDLALPPDVIVNQPTLPSPPSGWRTVTVGEARLSVPGDWRFVELDADGDEPCEVGLTYFISAVLFVADVRPTGNPAPCPPIDYSQPSAVGVYAFDLKGAIRPELEGGEPVEINGLQGIVRIDRPRYHYPLPDGDERVERVDIRHYRFPQVDLGLLIRADPDPELAERIVDSIKPVSREVVEDFGHDRGEQRRAHDAYVGGCGQATGGEVQK